MTRSTYVVHAPGDVPGQPFVATKARAKRLMAQHAGSYRWLGTTCHVYLRPVVDIRAILAVKVTP